MIRAKSMEEVEGLIQNGKKTVFVFTADWCGDCRVLKPHYPTIEAHFPDWIFVELDRDEFMPLAQQWDIFGIPSFLVIENGKEIARFVDKNRKTKEQVIEFLEGC
ncbi:thioredoxin family protein [Streptococcus sp. DD13]|uniref:thioredoxin family protein n=1 Tax=Streptococcus sp. DD13 TaxID=1777881 RepID=UPI000796B7A0|nr:thioredoxin family protein [Streptococcus sp. DD13]KXT77903.1 Thioredoxin [Streptococcus sp. DD13]